MTDPGVRPTVSVVVPCFDAQRFLPAALDSLLGQTFRDLEIVAVDDGSTDATGRILDAYADHDARVRVLRNASNQGLTGTLNRATGETRGRFIARLDADDIAAPLRIERQVATLTSRPEIGVLGTAVAMLGADDRQSHRALRCREPGAARFTALLATPLVHTTIMARAEVMVAHPYADAPDSLHTEDYELFSRMLRAGVALANLDETLVAVRVRPDGVSLTHEDVQIRNFLTCSRRHLERTRGARPERSVHRVIVNRMDRTTAASDLTDGLRWLARIEQESASEAPGCAQEIHGVADLQRIDILTQAILKGRWTVRLAAVGQSLRYSPRGLRSAAARRHVAAKFLSLPFISRMRWGRRSRLSSGSRGLVSTHRV